MDEYSFTGTHDDGVQEKTWYGFRAYTGGGEWAAVVEAYDMERTWYELRDPKLSMVMLKDYLADEEFGRGREVIESIQLYRKHKR
jgi:hypothetical protein